MKAAPQSRIETPSSPVVGDLVHFYTSDRSLQARGFGAGPYAAVVTNVRAEGLDLTVMATHRPPFPVFAVPAGGEDAFARADRDPAFSKWWRPKGAK